MARVMSATARFNFDSQEQFKSLAREAVLGWTRESAGKRFHARLHRRGFKGQLSSPEEERQLDAALLDAPEKAATPGAITFDAPDAILAIETVDNRAGLSLWTREDLRRFPLLRLD